jgi:hypothetical protein
MDTNYLLKFIVEKVPTFENPTLLDSEGVAYHYTSHWDKIQAFGKFLGAKIDEDLDRTQLTPISPPAKDDPGIVFAYENEAEAREEADGLDVVKIRYRKAVKAFHSHENDYMDFTDNYMIEKGYEGVIKRGPYATLLIISTDILSFERI